eukprot:Awhi_evm1s8293
MTVYDLSVSFVKVFALLLFALRLDIDKALRIRPYRYDRLCSNRLDVENDNDFKIVHSVMRVSFSTVS